MPTVPDDVSGQSGLAGSEFVAFAKQGIAFVPTVTSLNAQEVLVVPLELQVDDDCAAAIE